MNTSKALVTQSLNSALTDGDLSATSHQILVENLDANTLAGAQGVSPEELVEDRVTLVVPVVDATGSMTSEAHVLRAEYNKMLDALSKSKARDTILVSSWLFETTPTLLHGFVSLDDAVKLDDRNYSPGGMTAMYDAVLDVFTSTTAYAKSLLDQGYRVRVVVVVLTDGEDNSSRTRASEIAQVAKDLLNTEVYTLALVSFGKGFAFEAAERMGFPPENVLEAGKSERDIRHALALVSSSVIKASTTQVASTGGFFS